MANLATLIEGETPVLVDFSAEWCGPCQMLKPELKELARQMRDRLVIVTVDVDNPKNQTFAASQGVRSVPTLVLFHRGKVLWRTTGYRSAVQLQREIEPYLPTSAPVYER
ncbi:MAG: thioredoxin family protein [Bacteroidota bacterium]|nr:thioredoxin family protein [Candidatus Kapabacteria bacterium]MCS7302948.1 thioredoxin family protein [Candidatus Kapabacteria bacterium]MCX7937487.1 thioredoxin family protein [Chlorobiota bacterium]MDW8075136.1 thioredoxin family protein [Bacteroidota bacterium]MDW8271975.1 thioredoxin family protein [Bacteroidota bacterium]